MVSVQLGVDVAEALVRLRAYAFRPDCPIASVAAAVVERALRFDAAGASTRPAISRQSHPGGGWA